MDEFNPEWLEIGKRVKDLRKELKMTQPQLANILLVTTSGVCDIERGRRKLTEKHLQLLAKYPKVKINIEWLLTGKGDMIVPRPDDETLQIFFDSILLEPRTSFKKRFMLAIANLPQHDWYSLETLIRLIRFGKHN